MNLALKESVLPVRLRFDRPMTDEELMRFCAANEPLRVERDANGELIVMSPVGIEGGGIETDVTAELTIWARADGRGKAFGATTGFKLPDSSVRSADSAWVSWQRLNSVSREQREGFGPICPEFIIEVRSKSDRLPPLQAKMGEWIANGVAVAWLIDPLEKAVTIYRPGEQPELLAQPTSVQGTGPIAGFELVLARVWG